jgi:hypothetical protein
VARPPSTPFTPNEYFSYNYRVYKQTDGKYKVTGQTVANYSGYVYDAPTGSRATKDGSADTATQLGEVPNDHFTYRFLDGTSTEFIYNGETPDGKNFVATLAISPNTNTYQYIFTNDNTGAYNRLGSRPEFSVENQPFTVCYVAGTSIRTTRGDVAVEQLAVGDLVITASGAERPIKWLGHRAYSGRLARSNPDLLPICFKAGALAESMPARDLWVSSKHAMFIDGALIPAEHLVNGVTIVRADRVESVDYWHVELDSHDVLLAEDTPSESFVDDNGRGIFHNAHTFHAMYPDEERIEAIYCAPRIEDGYVLDAVRRRLAERAGLAVPPMLGLGSMRGKLDLCDGTMVQGWAQDMAYPDAPVCLDIVVDGARVAIVYAEHFRDDLRRADIGDGYHAFSLRLAAPLSREVPHDVEIRRSADGMVVGNGRRLEAVVAETKAFAAA